MRTQDHISIVVIVKRHSGTVDMCDFEEYKVRESLRINT